MVSFHHGLKTMAIALCWWVEESVGKAGVYRPALPGIKIQGFGAFDDIKSGD